MVPNPSGKGTLVTGKGRAWVRRFDNKFLAGLAGGLPYLEADLVRGNDFIVHFRNLVLTAPKIRIAGTGFRRRDGTFFFEGKGAQVDLRRLRDEPRRPDRAAEAGDPPRPAERGARA